MLLQVLGALEVVRQLLVDGVLDHPAPGEADERPGLGYVDVAEHRERGRDAAGGGVGEHRDVGEPRLLEFRDRGGGLGHLHEREDALLHPRAAGGAEQDERQPLRDGALAGAGNALAGAGAERPAHEREVHHPEHRGVAVDAADAHYHRLRLAALCDRGLDLVAVGAGRVAELEVVGVAHLAEHLLERAFVGDERNARAHRQPAVVVALGADSAGLLPGGLAEVALALRAHCPDRLLRRNRGLFGLGDEPGHRIPPWV